MAEKISIGALAPLDGFMGEDDYKSVTDSCRLASGEFFPVPLSLPITRECACRISSGDTLLLCLSDNVVGRLTVRSVFRLTPREWGARIFGTDQSRHPGLAAYLKGSGCFAGGLLEIYENQQRYLSFGERKPDTIRTLIARSGSPVTVGFASRNVAHLGHIFLMEKYLQKGLGFLNLSTIGAFQRGHYTVEAIKMGNAILTERFRGMGSFISDLISMPPMLMGPREAMLQALIRRNYGCTHFIVGRDHSGVAGLYSKYEAQEAAVRYEQDIGVKIIPEKGPFYCTVCEDVVDEDICRHGSDASTAIGISSSKIRTGQHQAQKIDRRLFDEGLWAQMLEKVPQIFEP